jgi:two-component system, NtrC family, response regulator AtoC
MTTKSHKILIIDDEKEICSLLTEYFTEDGYTVEVAYDGEDGIAKVKTFEPDIIILDHRMPIMDGAAVISKVREFSSTPIICVSAVTNKETIDECLKLGATEYMFKPIDLEELDRAIESALKAE